MKAYRSFRYESTRLHAVRLAYIVSRKEDPPTWDESSPDRNKYRDRLTAQWSRSLAPFCLLKAAVDGVCYFNPPDPARWRLQFPIWSVGPYSRSHMIPAEFVLSACMDETIDSKLREALCVNSHNNHQKNDPQVQVVSWFGYAPPATVQSFESCPFRRLFDKEIDPNIFHQLALVFLQHTNLGLLTDISKFFSGLTTLTLDRTQWTPLIAGLLWGNVDGFVLLGKKCPDPGSRAREQHQLSAFLGDALFRKRHGSFWDNVSPVAAYFGDATGDDLVPENIEILEMAETTTETIV